MAQSRRTLYSAIGDPIDDVQFMFEVLGNVPVAGEIFDGMNGLIYLGRGQKVNAMASFAAIVPLVGTGLKYGVKGVAKTGGWLAFHEGPTLGHTLARHVGKTDADLIGRLAAQSRITGASSFASEEIAESVISSTISGNRAAIKSWLNSSAPVSNMVLEYTGSTNVGRGIMRRTGIVNDLTNARVVLKQNGKGGYFILTAFPR